MNVEQITHVLLGLIFLFAVSNLQAYQPQNKQQNSQIKLKYVDTEHPDSPEHEISPNDPRYYNGFKSNCITIFLIHGWYQVHQDPFNKTYKEIHKREKCANVVKVEWTGQQTTIQEGYYDAAKRILSVSSYLADHILELHYLGLTQNKVVLIAHSMGGHIAGTTGRVCHRRGRQLDAVIALDPSGPGFTDYDLTYAKYKLTQQDAAIVKTLFTNKNYLGSSEPIGHVIFYANDGDNQPGCNYNIICDHFKAVEYFNDSQNKRTYVAHDKMGRKVQFRSWENQPHGIYYFSTRSNYEVQPSSKAYRSDEITNDSSSKRLEKELQFYKELHNFDKKHHCDIDDERDASDARREENQLKFYEQMQQVDNQEKIYHHDEGKDEESSNCPDKFNGMRLSRDIRFERHKEKEDNIMEEIGNLYHRLHDYNHANQPNRRAY